MKPYDHAVASAKTFGGTWEDFIEIHNFFDQFRSSVGDPRHRMFLHNTNGVLLCEQVFGPVWAISGDKSVATRDIAEHHIISDLGKIPTPQEWLDNIGNPDFVKPTKSKLERAVDKTEETEIIDTPSPDKLIEFDPIDLWQPHDNRPVYPPPYNGFEIVD